MASVEWFPTDDFRHDDDFVRNGCDSLSRLFKYSYVCWIGGIFSVLSYLFLFYLYFIKKSPVLKRHPTTLAIYKCIFEFFFVQQFLWLPWISNNTLYEDGSYQDQGCRSSTFAAVLSFISQFTLLGGELCFFVISWDLRLAYTNPFSSYKENKRIFAAVVILIALTTSAILMLLGPTYYGVAVEGVIWIQDRRNDGNLDPNYTKMCLFYLWMLVIYAYCVWALWILSIKMHKGFVETLNVRISIMKRAQTYVIGYCIFWGVLLSSEFISYLIAEVHVAKILTSGVAYLFSWRGVWTLIVILYTNRSELTWRTLMSEETKNQKDLVENVVEEGLLLKPHLNSALRAEILFFTTQGIMFATRECKKHSEFSNKRFSPSELSSQMDEPERLYSFKEKLDASDFIFSEEMASREIAKRNEIQRAHLSRAMASEVADEAEDMGLELNRDSSRNVKMQSSRNSQESNPMTSHLSITEVELSASNLRLGIENDEKHRSTTSSASSASTVKWRDTMDIEFTISKKGDDGILNRQTSWQQKSTSRSNISMPSSDSDFGSVGESPSFSSRSRDSSKHQSTDSHVSSVVKIFQTVKSLLSVNFDEFVFKDFNPILFQRIRTMCDISPEEYANSFITTTKETFSEGRSGSFMFYSSNQKYVVKTTTKEEIMALQRILRRYVDYLSINRNSLIIRYLGAHCITMYGQELYFVVMKNVFPVTPLSERYDLKGSWVNRHRTIEKKYVNDRKMKEQDTSVPLYLDNDVQQKIAFAPQVSNALADQIRGDVAFLRELGLMDYSLLIGVKRQRFEVLPSDIESQNENSNNQDPLGRETDGGLRVGVVEGPGKYYIGIIDVLQEWNWKKKFERYFKIYFLGKDSDGLSAIHPDKYAARFYDRCVVDLLEGIESNTNYFVPKTKIFRRSISRQSSQISSGSTTFSNFQNDNENKTIN